MWTSGSEQTDMNDQVTRAAIAAHHSTATGHRLAVFTDRRSVLADDGKPGFQTWRERIGTTMAASEMRAV
jgi:hypothetical protein